MIRVSTYDETDDINTEIESVKIEAITPVVCIFCKFTTCIEFDMEQHLYGNHRISLLKLSLRRNSFDSRIEYAINEGEKVGATSQLDENSLARGTSKQCPAQAPPSQEVSLRMQRCHGHNSKTRVHINSSRLSIEKFFSDEQSLPLRSHSIEQSPCYPIDR